MGTGLQAFHRDLDDWRFVKLFVYLTDVDEGSGPYVQVAGTTDVELAPRPLLERPEVERAHGAARVASFLGAAGTGLAADSYGLHKGAVRGPAGLQLQLQYPLLPVYAYRYEPRPSHGPLRPDPYINRLFLRQAAPAEPRPARGAGPELGQRPKSMPLHGHDRFTKIRWMAYPVSSCRPTSGRWRARG